MVKRRHKPALSAPVQKFGEVSFVDRINRIIRMNG